MDQSLENLGYTQAVSNDTLEDKAHEAIAKIPGFPETCPDESKAALVSGYRKRYAEKNPSETYAVIDGNYVLATPDMEKNKKVEKLEIGVEYAYHYTQQQFGKLKGENPELHKIVGEIRKLTSTYVSNTYKELTKPESVKRERGATKDFSEFVEAWFNDTAKQRLISGKARGDLTADEKRFSKAKVAFMTIWNAK